MCLTRRSFRDSEREHTCTHKSASALSPHLQRRTACYFVQASRLSGATQCGEAHTSAQPDSGSALRQGPIRERSPNRSRRHGDTLQLQVAGSGNACGGLHALTCDRCAFFCVISPVVFTAWYVSDPHSRTTKHRQTLTQHSESISHPFMTLQRVMEAAATSEATLSAAQSS